MGFKFFDLIQSLCVSMRKKFILEKDSPGSAVVYLCSLQFSAMRNRQLPYSGRVNQMADIVVVQEFSN